MPKFSNCENAMSLINKIKLTFKCTIMKNHNFNLNRIVVSSKTDGQTDLYQTSYEWNYVLRCIEVIYLKNWEKIFDYLDV